MMSAEDEKEKEEGEGEEGGSYLFAYLPFGNIVIYIVCLFGWLVSSPCVINCLLMHANNEQAVIKIHLFIFFLFYLLYKKKNTRYIIIILFRIICKSVHSTVNPKSLFPQSVSQLVSQLVSNSNNPYKQINKQTHKQNTYKTDTQLTRRSCFLI